MSLLVASTYQQETSDRDTLTSNVVAEYSDYITFCDLTATTSIQYVSPMARVQTYFSCNVPTIIQEPGAGHCWAAATASIVHSIRGASYTEAYIVSLADVPLAPYGGLEIEHVVRLIRNNFNLDYTHDYVAPSQSVITSNIRNGYPVYARWETDKHYGLNGGIYVD